MADRTHRNLLVWNLRCCNKTVALLLLFFLSPAKIAILASDPCRNVSDHVLVIMDRSVAAFALFVTMAYRSSRQFLLSSCPRERNRPPRSV